MLTAQGCGFFWKAAVIPMSMVFLANLHSGPQAPISYILPHTFSAKLQDDLLIGGTYWTSLWNPEMTRSLLRSLAPPGLDPV